MAKKYLQTCLSSLATKEMQIKQLWEFTLPQSGWQRLTKQLTTDAGGDVGKGKPSFTVGGITNWSVTLEISVEKSQ